MTISIDFNPGTYEAIRDRCEQLFEDILERIRIGIRVISQLPAITAAIWKPVQEWLEDALGKVGSFLKDLGQGIAAPIMFFFYAWDWIKNIGEPMATTTANVSQDNANLPLSANTQLWEGPASVAYTDATKNQSKAADIISGRAFAVAGILGSCAAAGLAFYTAVVAIIFATVVAIKAAIAAAALTGGAAAPAVILVIVEGLGKLVVAAGIMAVAQVGAAHLLQQQTTEGGTFVGKAWPTGTADFSG